MSNAAQYRRQPRWNHYWSSVEGRRRVHRVRRNTFFSVRSHQRTLSAEVMFLGGILIALQILDGILTGLGMHHFGVDMEGNFFLRTLMENIGFIPALFVVKSVAVGVVASLCMYAWKISWLKMALRGIIFFYLSFAVVPWALILIPHILA